MGENQDLRVALEALNRSIARQERLAETNANLQGNLAALMARLLNDPEGRNRDEELPPRREDKSLKVDVHSFDGSLDPEKYLEWETSLERYFECKDRKDLKLSDIVCYKCGGRGHFKKDCPNSRALTMQEEAENPKEEDGEDDCFPEEEDRTNLVVPKEVVVQPQQDIDDADTMIVEVLETENVGELLPLRAGEDVGSFEQGTESLQGKESEGSQETPRNDMARPTMRKFETFETLFDPPKFVPEFMKQSVVNDVEATKFAQRDDEAVFIDGIYEEDRGNNKAEAEIEAEVEMLFFNNKVPFHVIKTYAFGSFAVFELDLNKIRGRISLKKRRMTNMVKVRIFKISKPNPMQGNSSYPSLIWIVAHTAQVNCQRVARC